MFSAPSRPGKSVAGCAASTAHWGEEDLSKTPAAGGLTRRHMLAAISAGAVATAAGAARAGSGAGAAAARPRVLGPIDLERGTFADWSAVVGRTFRLADASGAPLKLVAVEPVNSDGPRPGAIRRRRGFSAIFEANPARAPAGDRTHWIALGAHPPLPVFLSPPVEISGKMRFAAVFN